MKLLKYINPGMIPMGSVIALFLLSVFSESANAQDTANEVPLYFFDPVNYLMIFTLLILIITIGVLVRVIRNLVRGQIGPAKKPVRKVTHAPEKPVSGEKINWWTKLDRKLTDAVPLEQEEDVLLNHEYDGIRELDNSLPPWWKYGFYLTIVFAAVYLLHYHVIGSGKLQIEEYEQQLAEAAAEKETRLARAGAEVDENTVTMLTDAGDLEIGKKIYIEKCAVCHGQSGEGGVGPNMTDNYWIHGGSINDIFKVIKYGVPQKGMISWQSQINPKEMQQVSSYLRTLIGTDPPNQKEPQGELYKEDVADEKPEEPSTASADTSGQSAAIN